MAPAGTGWVNDNFMAPYGAGFGVHCRASCFAWIPVQRPAPYGAFFMPKIMIISFELTMPNVGSWNGNRTGSDNKYYHIVSLNKARKKLVTELVNNNKTNFSYNFGDGWVANIKMEIVDKNEAIRRRNLLSGFRGYQWMCHEILEHGKIFTLSERDDLKQEKMELKNEPDLK